ncbi:MAG TPA: GNAT family N-acetyltransferase [Thermobifida alba]|nr:GNAT family N-acetyltransferase [Thermobifida alba]
MVRLLNEAGSRLEQRGLDQWGEGWMTPDRMAPMIAAGETFVVDDGAGHLLATVSLSTTPDQDFWTTAEQQQPALYLSKLARANEVAGVGEWTLDQAVTHAARAGYPRVRLDAWATNERLHEYYRRRGWRHLRTMDVEGRRSGALFERPTGV